jgi:diacylglycerol kinase (ATP)
MLKQLMHATQYSFSGLKLAYKQELAFRLEIYFSCILIPLAYYLASNTIELVLLVCSWLFVLIMELVNTAIEAVVDRISKDPHELSRVAKDVASAAVLLALMQFVVVWGLLI